MVNFWKKYLAASLLVVLIGLPQALSAVEVNRYEQELIHKHIVNNLKQMVQLWQEELYFELYDHGQQQSQTVLKKGEFAQRMVDLRWRPKVQSEKTKIEEIKIFHRTYAAVIVSVHFQNKLNPDDSFVKKMIYPVVLEYENDKKKEKEWKFDLLQLIKTPFK